MDKIHIFNYVQTACDQPLKGDGLHCMHEKRSHEEESTMYSIIFFFVSSCLSFCCWGEQKTHPNNDTQEQNHMAPYTFTTEQHL